MFASLHVHSRLISLALIQGPVRYQKGSVDLIYWLSKLDVTVLVLSPHSHSTWIDQLSPASR